MKWFGWDVMPRWAFSRRGQKAKLRVDRVLEVFLSKIEMPT
jgi:hypothetical protein